MTAQNITSQNPLIESKFSKQNLQRVTFFIGYLATYIVGMAIFPFLPLYANELGISPALIGVFMASAFGAITLGTMWTVPIARRIGTKRAIVVGSLASSVALFTLIHIQTFVALYIGIAIIWFAAGIIINIIQIATGQVTAVENRDKAFGILFMGRPAAALIAGVLSGPLIEWGDYALLFSVLIGFMLLITVIGQFMLPPLELEADNKKSVVKSTDDSRAITFLLVSVIVSGVAASYGTFALSVLMDSGGFSPSELSLTGAIAGVSAVPITKLVNFISSRWGQRHSLWFGYALTALSMIIFIEASNFWHFSLAASLLWAAQSANGSSALALVSILATKKSQGRRLSQLQTALWGARIISFISVGIVVQFWSIQIALVLAGGLLLTSIVLIALSNRPVPPTPCNEPTCLEFNPT